MFWSKFPLADVQDFLAEYKNTTNKDDYLKNYATEERKKPSIINHIEASILSVLNEDGLGYCGGAGEEKEMAHIALQESIKKIIFLLDNWDVLSRDRVRKFATLILKVINGSTITKTEQYTKSNLSVEKPQIPKRSGHIKEARFCMAQPLLLTNQQEEDRRGNIVRNGERDNNYYRSYQRS